MGNICYNSQITRIQDTIRFKDILRENDHLSMITLTRIISDINDISLLKIYSSRIMKLRYEMTSLIIEKPKMSSVESQEFIELIQTKFEKLYTEFLHDNHQLKLS
jgi:hypothetical protein